jgi:hypothetical protein
LCSSADGRPVCEAAERGVALERFASDRFPAAPSYLGLPYDRSEVDVAVSLARAPADTSTVQPSGRSVGRTGLPITPEVASTLFERIKGVNEGDGCRVVGFNTARFRGTIRLEAPTGRTHAVDVIAARGQSGDRIAGDWVLTVSSGLDAECGKTASVIERILSTTAAPKPH